MSLSRQFTIFIDTVFNNQDTGVKKNLKMNKSSLSSNNILAGDVVFFKYKDRKNSVGEHLVLVVGNNRTRTGVFSGKSGKYLSAIKLNGLDGGTASILLEKLYKDRNVNYHDGILAAVGKNNYRTYKLHKIYNYYETSLDFNGRRT